MILASSFTGKNMTRYIRMLQHSRATSTVFQISGLLVMNRGPTWMPWSMKAPMSTAVVESPGMPRLSRGTRAPPVRPLLEVSEAIRPSGTPVPSSSGCLDQLLAWE